MDVPFPPENPVGPIPPPQPPQRIFIPDAPQPAFPAANADQPINPPVGAVLVNAAIVPLPPPTSGQAWAPPTGAAVPPPVVSIPDDPIPAPPEPADVAVVPPVVPAPWQPASTDDPIPAPPASWQPTASPASGTAAASFAPQQPWMPQSVGEGAPQQFPQGSQPPYGQPQFGAPQQGGWAPEFQQPPAGQWPATPTNVTSAEASAPSAKKKSKKGLIIGIVAVVLVAALGVAAYFILPGLLADPRHPKAKTAEEALNGYFAALKADDIELALEYLKEQPTDTTFMTNEFYQTMLDKHPLDNLFVIDVVDTAENEYIAHVTVDVGDQKDTPLTVGLALVDKHYVLLPGFTTVTLENTTAPSPLTLGGISLADKTSIELLPGIYTVEMNDEVMTLTNPVISAGTNVPDYSGAFAFKFEMKKEVKTQITTAAQAKLDRCLALKTLELIDCNVGFWMSAYPDIDPSTIVWTVSSGTQPKNATWTYDLNTRVAVATLNVKLHVSAYEYGGRPGSGNQTIDSVVVDWSNLSAIKVEFLPSADN
jgi:hypothetical protein